MVTTSRRAYFGSHATVSREVAVVRVNAEVIAPYPPGIPVLAPGEEITAGALSALRQARVAGVRIAYAADPTLATIRGARRRNALSVLIVPT